jgi:hypothetical protein
LAKREIGKPSDQDETTTLTPSSFVLTSHPTVVTQNQNEKESNNSHLTMSSSSSSSDLLFQPTEMSNEEYQSLLQQIRDDWTIPECQEELMEAARYNDIDVVRAILQVHPQLLPIPPVEERRGGNTPLHM